MMNKTYIAHLPEDHFFLKLPQVEDCIERAKNAGEPHFFTVEVNNSPSVKLSLRTIYDNKEICHRMTLKINKNTVEIGTPYSSEKMIEQFLSSERYGI